MTYISQSDGAREKGGSLLRIWNNHGAAISREKIGDADIG